jgi:hypothetical protein
MYSLINNMGKVTCRKISRSDSLWTGQCLGGIYQHSVDFGSNGLACGLGDRLGNEGEYGGDSGLKECSGVERIGP